MPLKSKKKKTARPKTKRASKPASPFRPPVQARQLFAGLTSVREYAKSEAAQALVAKLNVAAGENGAAAAVWAQGVAAAGGKTDVSFACAGYLLSITGGGVDVTSPNQVAAGFASGTHTIHWKVAGGPANKQAKITVAGAQTFGSTGDITDGSGVAFGSFGLVVQ